jgi:hypothetical protein
VGALTYRAIDALENEYLKNPGKNPGRLATA